jgi:hypothetical protein
LILIIIFIMNERFRLQPEDPKQHAPEAGAGPIGLPPPGAEHVPQGERSKRPEIHPTKEIPLPVDPNLSSQKQPTGNLDPEVERLMRAYAEAQAEGDPKKAESLFRRYRRDSSLIETFKEFHLRGAPTLATRGLDVGLNVSKLMEEPKKQE